MAISNKNNSSDEINRNLRAISLLKETKILNIARLAKLLVELFGLEDQFRKVGKREGLEVELNIPTLDGSIAFILTSDKKKFDCRVEKATNPAAIITLNVKEKDVLKVISSIIRSKANLFGLIKIAKLYILRKAKIEGSKMTALTACKCLMIGKNDIYKNKI